MNFLHVFPAEISLFIFEQLDAEELRRFARCSKLCYNFLLSIRFPSITLNRFSIPLFQDGGICEQSRSSVLSIRWECNLSDRHRPNWRHRMTDLRDEFRNDNDHSLVRRRRIIHEVEDLITRIRANIAAMNWFPNVRELWIAYQVPSSMGNNVFAAILKSLSPRLYDSLEHLDFQCYTELTAFYRRERKSIPYERIYPRLSNYSRQFLGEWIGNEEIKEIVAKTTPTLYSLRKAGITLNSLKVPLADTKFFEQSAFYYIPFSLAPRLENLCIRVGGIEEAVYKVDEGFDDELLAIFGGVGFLKIVKWLMGAEKPQINIYNFGHEGKRV